MNAQPLMQCKDVYRSFGEKQVLCGVSLTLERGQVLGLIGPNGAGKTTLIKHLLGLLQPDSGSVTTFGLNPSMHREYVLASLGYVSERRELPTWMRIADLMRFLEPFYPTWDRACEETLLERFKLDRRQRIRNLSAGELARTALVRALAYRPSLLVFDEPSSGLDPLARRDFLEVIKEKIASGGTVLFSSHLLDEVARVSDHIAILLNGKVVLGGELRQLLDASRLIKLSVPEHGNGLSSVPGVIQRRQTPSGWQILAIDAEPILRHVQETGGVVISAERPTLDDLFMVIASENKDGI